jgi:hypothetical protein
MLRIHLNTLAATARTNLAATLIFLGLALLFIASMVADLPVATAIALIALGASIAIRNAVQRLGWPREFLAAHLITYSGLYVLVICVTCNAAVRSLESDLSAAQVFDLGLSAIVMAYATRLCVAGLLRSKDHAA